MFIRVIIVAILLLSFHAAFHSNPEVREIQKPQTSHTIKIQNLQIQEPEVKPVEYHNKEDLLWLARNIYFEARSENLHGKMVVAFVTMNRVVNPRWPDTIKEVVTQRWQFSWYNNRVVPDIRDEKAWQDAKDIAFMCLDLYNSMAESEEFEVDGITKGADHYFATYIEPPSWAKKMKFIGKVGKHLLYKDA